MLILGICDVPEVIETMRIVNIVILILKIAVPIILIVSGMVTFMNSIKVGNEDLLSKAKKSLLIKCIAAVCVFLVPTIVDVLVDISGPDNEFRACLEANAYIDYNDNETYTILSSIEEKNDTINYRY